MKKTFLLDTFLFLFLGALSSISLPPFNFFLINFLTFSVFFIFLFKKLSIRIEKKFFFYYGWLFGFGYFLTNLYWISISLTFDQGFSFLIPVAFILVPAFLAIFYGLFVFLFFILNPKNVISAFFLFSLLFGLTEFIRGNILTGFPWNLIVYSFSENLTFISPLSIVGTYSFNLLMISFFVTPAVFFLRKSKKEIFICIFIVFLPILFIFYGSLYKENFLDNEIKKNPYIIRVIGSNISLERFYKNTQPDIIIDELITLSKPEKDKKIFFIWPEGIIPSIYQHELHLYDDLFKKNFNNNHIIGLGISNELVHKDKKKYLNSFSVFDSKLNLIKDYNKINLVPFGEFLPFENFLNKIGLRVITNNFGSFSKGDHRDIIEIKDGFEQLKFLPLICYEIIYSGSLTNKLNYDFILNISEDGWFGKSVGPKQHFVHSKFRAIETGKYVIRSSNNGIAAIINPLGEIEEKIDHGVDGFIDFEKMRVLNPTFFSIYGNKIFVIIILLYIFLFFSFNRNKNE